MASTVIFSMLAAAAWCLPGSFVTGLTCWVQEGHKRGSDTRLPTAGAGSNEGGAGGPEAPGARCRDLGHAQLCPLRPTEAGVRLSLSLPLSLPLCARRDARSATLCMPTPGVCLGHPGLSLEPEVSSWAMVSLMPTQPSTRVMLQDALSSAQIPAKSVILSHTDCISGYAASTRSAWSCGSLCRLSQSCTQSPGPTTTSSCPTSRTAWASCAGPRTKPS